MIINCENCNKKFNLDNNLIGQNGRLLKCSICNHTWFFKPTQNSKIKIIKNNIQNELDSQKNKNSNNFKNKNNEKTKKKNNNILSYFIAILISLISLILVIDTFKEYFSIIFPGINSALENLYESLNDLQLFFKDLLS